MAGPFVFIGMHIPSQAFRRCPERQSIAFLIAAAVRWLVLYQALNPAAEAMVAALPERVILRKVLKIRLIATFVAVVASGILLVGFVFNAVL